jgi:uncharacterized membrane protein YdjX (TVP38/TMEM64 family)
MVESKVLSTKSLRTMKPQNRSLGNKEIAKSCLVALSLSFFIAILYFSPIHEWVNPTYLQKLQGGMIVSLIFCTAGAILIGFGMPRSALSILAGGVFGFWLGLLLMEITALTGAMITFFYARFARQTFLTGVLQRQMPILDEYMEKHGFLTTLLLRQTPLPGLVCNILIGLSCVKIRVCVAASLIGFLPQNIVFTLYGSGLQQSFLPRVLLASSLLVAFSILFYFFYQRFPMVRNLVFALGRRNKQT